MAKLYVAYGSNLNKAAMRRRCPGARPLGRILLKNSKLVFRGVADLEYVAGAATPCGIWRITREDERELDAYEGVSAGLYYKDQTIVLRWEGEKYKALVYLMSSQGIYPPSQYYVDGIRKGYQDFNLDQRYLDEAIEHSFDEKDPDEQTRRRRVRQRDNFTQRELVTMPEAVALKRLQMREASERQ
jgi:hypothetical protein